MGSSSLFCLSILLLCSLALKTSFAHYVSHDVLSTHDQPGRLLRSVQHRKCPADFSKVNYSPLLKKCKGPPYSANPCCDGLKQVLCPYTNQLNDVRTSCAADIFYYINTKGNYAPGLFNDLCKKFVGKHGLSCKGYV